MDWKASSINRVMIISDSFTKLFLIVFCDFSECKMNWHENLFKIFPWPCITPVRSRALERVFTYCSCWLPEPPPGKRQDHLPWCRSQWLPSPSPFPVELGPADSIQQAHCTSQQTHMLDLDFQCARSKPRVREGLELFTTPSQLQEANVLFGCSFCLKLHDHFNSVFLFFF